MSIPAIRWTFSYIAPRCAVAILLCSGLSATASAQPGPEAVAGQYLAAIRQNDFATAARLTHPAALRQLRELFEPLLEGEMFAEVGPALFGVQSRAELARTADTTLFASFLRNVLGQRSDLTEALKTSKVSIIGNVQGGADTVFVVARMELTVEGVSITQFDVMPFARYAGQWRALMKADFSNMAAMMRRAIGQRGQ